MCDMNRKSDLGSPIRDILLESEMAGEVSSDVCNPHFSLRHDNSSSHSSIDDSPQNENDLSSDSEHECVFPRCDFIDGRNRGNWDTRFRSRLGGCEPHHGFGPWDEMGGRSFHSRRCGRRWNDESKKCERSGCGHRKDKHTPDQNDDESKHKPGESPSDKDPKTMQEHRSSRHHRKHRCGTDPKNKPSHSDGELIESDKTNRRIPSRHGRKCKNVEHKSHQEGESGKGIPPRCGGRHGFEKGFHPRHGGRHWGFGPEEGFPPRRGGPWGFGPEEGFPPRCSGPWSFGLEEGFPSRHGGRHRRGLGPEGGFPPRCGGPWSVGPGGIFPPRHGGPWGFAPEEGFPPRCSQPWSFGLEDGFPSRHSGRLYRGFGPEGFPPRRGGPWSFGLEERFPTRRGGRRPGFGPEEGFPSEFFDEPCEFGPQERFPPRHGGRHWGFGPEEGFPPRRGGPWSFGSVDEFPSRPGDESCIFRPEVGFSPRHGGRHQGSRPKGGFFPKCGGPWSSGSEEKSPQRYSGRHWGFGPGGFPPRCGGGYWGFESDERSDSRYAGRHHGGGSLGEFPARYSGRHWGCGPKGGFPQKCCGPWGEREFPPRHGGGHGDCGSKGKSHLRCSRRYWVPEYEEGFFTRCNFGHCDEEKCPSQHEKPQGDKPLCTSDDEHPNLSDEQYQGTEKGKSEEARLQDGVAKEDKDLEASEDGTIMLGKPSEGTIDGGANNQAI